MISDLNSYIVHEMGLDFSFFGISIIFLHSTMHTVQHTMSHNCTFYDSSFSNVFTMTQCVKYYLCSAEEEIQPGS